MTDNGGTDPNARRRSISRWSIRPEAFVDDFLGWLEITAFISA